MRKILIISTVSRQFYLFEQANIEVLKSLGYEVHAAANFSDSNERLHDLGIILHPFDIQRSPLSLKNIKAYKQLRQIMNSTHFDAVHCHSPMGGVLARLVAKHLGIGPVLYTAHGFHFFQGASLVNWLIYYPIEKYLSRYTDVLITINLEDHKRAEKLWAKKVVYVPGIGVKTKNFREAHIYRDRKREELGISNETIVLLSVGEMIKRKNHETAIKAFAKIDRENVFYVICGIGALEDHLRNLVNSLGINDRVKFLGYRNDISELCAAADILLFPSYQEGLPVSVMEAMAAGLPCITSDIRGNRDLISNGEGGYLCNPEDISGFVRAINVLSRDATSRKRMSMANQREIKRFDIENVKREMKKIYESALFES